LKIPGASIRTDDRGRARAGLVTAVANLQTEGPQAIG
jgi:hypothetical protein